MTGEGLDSVLEFSTLELQFEPIIPYTEGGLAEVVVFNPHPVPIELYSLEFDRQYLEEEHILRTLPGYGEFETLVLPPRQPGEPLAAEVRSFYAELVHRTGQPVSLEGTLPPASVPVSLEGTLTSASVPVSLEGTLPPASVPLCRQPVL
ncbi:hydrocephalus-inducing protein-like [Pollicipes pollicipes]|uniref:hydrocephalus-inducing protein-like n=1 Tax=Pollicipes pollicipes TaxID=41117 RepID=UPI00188494C5|nr:hydrocephalus-inducing protein-like [Pollicipes pollicipes]